MHNPTKIKLDNGLLVLLKEIHSAPIISLWTWYRVGSRYEKPGFTGISHWVEHMQFKGTEKYPSTAMDRLIAREGGVWNAFTHVDWTTYFETMPANKIDLALDLEADRMVNSLFSSADVESERSVIISEKEGKDNEPFLRLNNAVNEAAFLFHPYRNEVIGSLEDLQRIQRDDLFHHYRKYYQPANTIISIAGDFNTSAMIEKIQKKFISVPSEFLPDPDIQPEHEILEKKEILLSGPGDTIFIQIAYRSPSAADPDFFGFSILDSLLSGPASLNMFGGGGTSNKTSRLYKKLVDKGLAVSLAGGLQATIDPHLYDLSITLNQGQDPEIVIKTIDQEIERLIEKRILKKEIQRAVKQARAMFAYGLENITNQAFWLGYSESFANYDWFSNYLDRLNEIKPQDVQRVAEKYLHPEKRVIGIYQPDFSESKQSL
ncbi:MAG: insulinase family protein [Anaerolineaceae bacterium]|nr:insulinase family protein [Anaerolineaceae bacterium]